jgi:hypothetical protein
MPYRASDMADLMSYDDLCARIYADRRMPPGTRELALTFAWTLLRDPNRNDRTSSATAYKVLGGARFRKLVAEDAPRYRRPQEWAGFCDGPRLRAYRPSNDSEYEKQRAERRASRCGTSARDRVDEYDMVTGQVTRVYWYCSRHKAEAERVRQQLLARGTPPPAIPNQGGLLPCYYEPDAVEQLYRWAVHHWTPPYHGICADDWPVPGFEIVPKRPRLALVVGGLESRA